MNPLKALNISSRKELRNTVFRNDWFEFSTGFHKPCLKVSPAGYFDPRAMIVISIGWGLLFLHLPIYSKYNECDPPQYGFYLYGEGAKMFTSLWLCLGSKVKCIHMPWEIEWYRTSTLTFNNKWITELKGNYLELYSEQWKSVIKYETHPYKYTCSDGTVQDDITATIKVSEMEWRPRWFMWTSLFAKSRKYIDITFDKEVGESRGDYKGGCLGCSYELRNGETPLECLKRMEAERKFR